MAQQIHRVANKSLAQGNNACGKFWKIVGSTVVVLAVAGLIVSLPDIKRYIRISTM